MRRHSHADDAVLITSAPESSDDEYDRRRRKYAIMMSLRIVCVIAAACTYQLSVPLAVFFIVGGAVLPWCAVLIANDRPARKRVAQVGFYEGPIERGLSSADDDRTVDG